MTQDFMHEQAQRPNEAAWKSAIVAMLGAVGANESKRDEYDDFLRALCVTAIRGGIMRGFGEAQSYLRRIGSPSQFLAMPTPMVNGNKQHAYDVRTNDEQTYYVDIIHGHEEIRHRLGRVMLSDELNEQLLNDRAGMPEEWRDRFGPPTPTSSTG